MSEQEMSTIGLIEACVEEAIARQKVGRVTREDCVGQIVQGMLTRSERMVIPLQTSRELAHIALDAALASGYVIINRP